MNQVLKFQPSRFVSLRATSPIPTDWESILQELRGDDHLQTTRSYRETLLAIQQAEQAGDTALADRLKERKDRLKQGQPAIVVSVSLQGGRGVKHITGYSGFILVDIDKVPDGRFNEALRLVRADPYTFLSHVTISGRGIRVIVRLANEVTGRDFPVAWRAVNDYYARLTGVPIDGQCKNATRMSVLCHDPEALYRPDARPFPLPVHPGVATRGMKKSGPRLTANRAAATVRQLVEREGIAYEPGHHNDYICRCLYWMNRFGVSHKEAEDWALQAFADYDAAAVRSTCQSCYAQVDEHATRRLREFERPAANRGRASIEDMERYLEDHLEIRRNRLTSQIEIRPLDSETWQRLDDTIENSIWRAMQKAGIDADLFRLRTLLTSDFARDYHPLADYLDRLPPWDGVTDHIGRLAGMVHTRHTPAGWFDNCLRRWLVGMLAGALDERVVNQVILVLIGRQGCYKTSFMQNLLPPCLRRYYTTKTNSQRLSKDDLFTITENLIVNFEEIDTMRPSELNQLKAMTTTLYIDERPPYGRNKVHLPHIASFCATGNNPLFLSDETGNRRWLVFEVTSIDNPWEHPIDHDGIYAQAKALLDRGYQYWFKDREIEVLDLRNRQFETPNPARELILTHYRKPDGLEKVRYVSASQIVARFGGSIRLTPSQVGRALKRLGFESVHTRNGNFWLMVDRTYDEINGTLPEEIETDI